MLPVLLWAGLVVTKMFSQFLVELRVTPAPAQHPAAVNSCGSIMEKKNGDVWRNGRLAGMNM